MNTNYKRVPTRFAPDTRFEVTPAPAAVLRADRETDLDRLKEELLVQFLEDRTNRGFNAYVRRAADDAAALAWVTPYPLLVFPGLFEEKAEAALQQIERQESVRRRSLDLLAL